MHALMAQRRCQKLMGLKQRRELIPRKYKLLNLVPSRLESHEVMLNLNFWQEFVFHCSLFREKSTWLFFVLENFAHFKKNFTQQQGWNCPSAAASRKIRRCKGGCVNCILYETRTSETAKVVVSQSIANLLVHTVWFIRDIL